MKKTIRDFDLSNRKVIIRCDFNVPIKDGVIADDTRIKASLPTITYALEHGAKLILMSHLGKIKTEDDKQKNSLKLVRERLSEYLGIEIKFSNQTRGAELEKLVNELKPGEALLMENTRYEDVPNGLESGCDKELSKYWASLGEIFINDAFGTIHRGHASNAGIAKFLDSGIGFLIENELNYLERMNNPEHPFVVIMGGAKVSDKIKVIENLVTKADKLLIGGGMAFTFLKAKGINVGKSLIDEESIEFCCDILAKYSNKIILPIDVNAAEDLTESSINRVTKLESINEQEMGLDIGPNTIKLFSAELDNAKTIFWNGPLGAYENPKFALGTKKILEKIILLDATVVLGGGDIIACAANFGYDDKVSFVSTGGGATLEFLEGKVLPGIESITDKMN